MSNKWYTIDYSLLAESVDEALQAMIDRLQAEVNDRKQSPESKHEASLLSCMCVDDREGTLFFHVEGDPETCGCESECSLWAK